MSIKLENITFSYHNQKVLDNLNLDLVPGRITTLLGINGSGKTTLLKLLMRELRPSGGKITLFGQDIASYKRRDYAKMVAYLPQIKLDITGITVKNLVEMGRYPYHQAFHSLTDTDKKVVAEALELVGLLDLQDKDIACLSGGQRQRAYIAMALAQEPKILILDEPITFLDVRYQVEILQVIKRLNRLTNLTVLMVLHDLNLAAKNSDFIAIMADGKIAVYDEVVKSLTVDNVSKYFRVKVQLLNSNLGLQFVLEGDNNYEM